jgi:hypothetical protein
MPHFPIHRLRANQRRFAGRVQNVAGVVASLCRGGSVPGRAEVAAPVTRAHRESIYGIPARSPAPVTTSANAGGEPTSAPRHGGSVRLRDDHSRANDAMQYSTANVRSFS